MRINIRFVPYAGTSSSDTASPAPAGEKSETCAPASPSSQRVFPAIVVVAHTPLTKYGTRDNEGHVHATPELYPCPHCGHYLRCHYTMEWVQSSTINVGGIEFPEGRDWARVFREKQCNADAPGDPPCQCDWTLDEIKDP